MTDEMTMKQQLWSTLRKPYENGYTVAQSVSDLGSVYRVLAAISAAGGLIGLFIRFDFWGFLFVVVGVFLAVILSGLGVITRAVGELLRAVLDTAVHTRAAVEFQQPPTG